MAHNEASIAVPGRLSVVAQAVPGQDHGNQADHGQAAAQAPEPDGETAPEGAAEVDGGAVLAFDGHIQQPFTRRRAPGRQQQAHHTFICDHPQVIAKTVRFLQQGRFGAEPQGAVD